MNCSFRKADAYEGTLLEGQFDEWLKAEQGRSGSKQSNSKDQMSKNLANPRETVDMLVNTGTCNNTVDERPITQALIELEKEHVEEQNQEHISVVAGNEITPHQEEVAEFLLREKVL